MAMDREMRQIIAASRALVRRCDQGPSAWLTRLVQPLPPVVDDDWQQTALQLDQLTDFDPLAGLEDFLGRSTQAGTARFLTSQRKTPPIVPQAVARKTAGPGKNAPGAKPSKGTPEHTAEPTASGHSDLQQARWLADSPAKGPSQVHKSATADKQRSPDEPLDTPEHSSAHLPGRDQPNTEAATHRTSRNLADAAQTDSSAAPQARTNSLAAWRKMRAQQRFRARRGKSDTSNPHGGAASPTETSTRSAQPRPPVGSNTAADSCEAANAGSGPKSHLRKPAQLDSGGTAGTVGAAGMLNTSPPASAKHRESADSYAGNQGRVVAAPSAPSTIAPTPATGQPADDLAQQLADAAYLHGVDST